MHQWNERIWFNTAENWGFPHSIKCEQGGETEMTTNCAELCVPLSPALWNHILINQHQQSQNPKQKTHTKSFISLGDLKINRVRKKGKWIPGFRGSNNEIFVDSSQLRFQCALYWDSGVNVLRWKTRTAFCVYNHNDQTALPEILLARLATVILTLHRFWLTVFYWKIKKNRSASYSTAEPQGDLKQSTH